MIRTVEAWVDEFGKVSLLETILLKSKRRAFVTILDEEPVALYDTAIFSEASLAEDWNRKEEDEAWSHLQLAP